MKHIKSCLKLFYKEQGIQYIKTEINIKDYIYTDKYIVKFKNNTISHLYIKPLYRNMGLCGEIIKELTMKSDTYFVDIPKNSNNYIYLEKKFESYGFINGRLDRKYTYFVNRTDNFDKSTLFKLMKDFVRIETVPTYADLMILEVPYENYMKIDCKLRNHISNVNQVDDKGNLYLNLPYLMPTSYVIKSDTKISDIKIKKYPVIVKGTEGWCNSGASNQVCLTEEELFDFLFEKMGSEFMIQEYIINIDTSFKGLKYHLRMYWVVKFYDSPEPWRLMRRYRITTARNKYNKDDLTDKNNQDTHFGSTAAEYTDLDLPLEKAESFYKQTLKMCADMYELIKHIRDEVDAYYVFGLDLLPTESGKLYLIECNSYPSILSKENDKKATILSDYYYNEIYNFIIKPYFQKL